MLEIEKGRESRVEKLRAIEERLGARVLVYFTADSPLVGAQIGEDAPRPMFDHLRAFGKQKRIALYLYSPGGVMETPWKIIAMLREFCDELHVVVPYKAYSAATMIAIGADKIHMTRKAEFGPIDPSLDVPAGPGDSGPKLKNLGVEDVSAYLTFMRERAGLSDQSALAGVVEALAAHLTPPLLGRLERIYSHIRLVARNLLSLHQPPFDDRQVSAITEALTEKLYVHGHGIGRKEARQIGLDIADLKAEDEDLVWSLYESYERIFRLRDTREIESYFPEGQDVYERAEAVTACIESGERVHAFVGTIRVERIRQVPPNPNINVNLQLQLPPNVDAQKLPQAVQQAIQTLLQQAVAPLSGLVAQELKNQSNVVGIKANFMGGVWKDVVAN